MHHSRPAWVLLRGLAAPLALGGVLGGLAVGLGPAAVASAAACQVKGSPQPVSPVSDSQLAGVAMITSCDAWGVGTQRVSGDGSMLIEHFDGTAWKVVSAPAQVSSGGALASASAVSTSNVYAAGSIFVNAVPAPVIVHWNGTAWAQETLPSSLDGQEGQLLRIKAVSANDVWAVGETNVTVNSPVHVRADPALEREVLAPGARPGPGWHARFRYVPHRGGGVVAVKRLRGGRDRHRDQPPDADAAVERQPLDAAEHGQSRLLQRAWRGGHHVAARRLGGGDRGRGS